MTAGERGGWTSQFEVLSTFSSLPWNFKHHRKFRKFERLTMHLEPFQPHSTLVCNSLAHLFHRRWRNTVVLRRQTSNWATRCCRSMARIRAIWLWWKRIVSLRKCLEAMWHFKWQSKYLRFSPHKHTLACDKFSEFCRFDGGDDDEDVQAIEEVILEGLDVLHGNLSGCNKSRNDFRTRQSRT